MEQKFTDFSESKRLLKHGINSKVVSVTCLPRVDKNILQNSVDSTGFILEKLE